MIVFYIIYGDFSIIKGIVIMSILLRSGLCPH